MSTTPLGTITIDASTATAGMDFETFIRGSFVADVTGGGFPVFDNGSAFSGEEVYIGFGTEATSKYVLAHGFVEYFFSTHTVWGEINTIEYGTRGSGTYDGDGYFSGGNVELRITGLEFANAKPADDIEAVPIEATGEVHNFSVAHMYGSAADPARLALYADQLDQYAQHFIGSAHGDLYTGTIFDDEIEGRGGDDQFDGGDGDDTAVFTGHRADYDVTDNGDGTWTIRDNRTGEENDGEDTLANVEFARFADETVALGGAGNQAPVIEVAGDSTVFVHPTVGIPSNGISASAQAVDMDGDGDLDVVVMNASNSAVEWYANDGQGNIADTATTHALDGYGQSLVIADVDGDGTADIVATQSGGETPENGKVVWYKGNGDGTFGTSQVALEGQRNPYSVHGVDFDGDGDIDLLTATSGKSGVITLSTNDGTGQFTHEELAIGVAAPLAVLAVDIDGDGLLDIVNAGSATLGEDNIARGAAINVSINNGDGTFTTTTIDAGTTPQVWDVEVADIDGDGELDIVATNPNAPVSLVWYKGNGDGTFGAANDISAQDSGRTDSVLGDIDGDGDIDIVSMEDATGAGFRKKVSWFENDGNGNFTEHKTGLLIASEGSVALADLNADGILDIIRGGRAGAGEEVRTAEVFLGQKAIAVTENTPTALDGIAFADPDTGATVTVTLTVSAGTLSAASAAGVVVTGGGTDSVTLVGSIADINVFLAAGAVTFLTALDSEADVNLTIGIDDGMGAEALTASTTVLLDVTPFVGEPPEDLALTGSTVAEDAAPGTVVGTLSATDPEGDTLTYTLTSDAGGRFEIVGSELRVKGALDFEANASHTVSVRVTDANGNSVNDDFTITVTDVDEAPTGVALSVATVAEDVAVGSVVGTLSATDPENMGAITYALTDDGDGKFELVGNQIRVKAALDYETATVHDIVVTATDATGQTTTATLTIGVTNVEETGEQPPMITIDASTASAGIDFEAFIRGGFTTGTTGGGMPVFDNGGAFAGEEMMVGFGNDSASKYVLAHGELEYFFTTHTVWGEINTIEYGTRGSGSYDANGYFSGGNVELRITGLDLANAKPANDVEAVPIEANGPVHNFAVAHMYGAPTESTQGRYDTYADSLDTYAQHFIGSAHDDVYAGTRFNDEIEGGGGADILAGGGGNDTIDGGAGSDKALYTGNRADYDVTDNGDGTWTIKDNRTGEINDGEDTLTGVEFAEFADELFALEGSGSTNLAPVDLALSALTIAENSAAGAVVGVLSATDPEGQALTWTLTDSAGGRFGLVTEGGVTKVVVAGAIDYETATSHGISVRVSDGVNEVTRAFTITVTDEVEAPNLAPTNLALSATKVAENAAVGAVVGILSATDPEGQPLTYTLTGNAGGKFEIVGNELRVKTGLDYEQATSHPITVKVSDGVNEVTKDFTVAVTDIDESGPAGTITIDARGSNGIDFEAFITGGFLDGEGALGGIGMPVFDNGSSFSGAEMLIGFGTTAASKYVLAHGDLGYYFTTHTVWGGIDTIEYGTIGSGTYDANGHLVGSNVALRITGLSFGNPQPANATEEAAIEATGAVHNFAVGHMYGGSYSQARLDLYAEQLNAYAQIFLGSEGNDVYAGTRFDDTINGDGGEDILAGGGGNDTVNGGEGVDTFVFTGRLADYEIVTVAGVTTVTDRRAVPTDGVATLRSIEVLQFVDQQVTLVSDLSPVGLTLSANTVAEDAGVGSVVGVLSAADPEGGAVSYALSADADQKFEVVGNQLRLKAGLDFETKASHEIAVTVSDAGGNTSTKTFTIQVTDVLEPTIVGKPGGGTVKGTKGDDVIFGQGGKDVLKGGKGNDTLFGGGGKDKLDGGKGDDVLIGGAGKDVLKGGKGADTFVFQFASDSTVKGSGRDLIKDFSRKQSDKIDISAIDPLNATGTWDFIGKAKFSDTAGELRYQKKGGQTLISGDIDGDGKADFSIALAKAINLQEADFIL